VTLVSHVRTGLSTNECGHNSRGKVNDDVSVVHELSRAGGFNRVQVIFEMLGTLEVPDVFHAAVEDCQEARRDRRDRANRSDRWEPMKPAPPVIKEAQSSP